MLQLSSQPWPYLAIVLVTALLLRRRLKMWGCGFGVEVNHHPEEGHLKPRPMVMPRRKKKRGKR